MQTHTSNSFDQTLDLWIKELDTYSPAQLLAKPSPTSWSMGQLYVHLFEAAYFFIKQIHTCTSNNDNAEGEAFDAAKKMFRSNEFPDALLEGPPSNAVTPQPSGKEQIVSRLLSLKNEISKVETLMAQTSFKGKTKHFGLGYFTANEWLQFAEMHLRHHLRQKKRLDDFLAKNNIL